MERHAGIEDAVATQRPAIRINLVSDYICPWCFIGLARLEKLRADYDIQLDTTAYELRPGMPPEGVSREDASKGRTYPEGYLDNLRNTALGAGIEMKRPPHIPNTLKAHEATEFVKEHGGDVWAIQRALFHAYFEEERNIGDIEVICEVAASVGVDADDLRSALQESRYAGEVARQIQWARDVGVTGVPTVIFNEKFAIVGAQDELVFRDVAKRVAAGRVESDESHATA
ncbi:MAG: DsbA family oxidoreductase [Chloroflexota bacterium]